MINMKKGILISGVSLVALVLAVVFNSSTQSVDYYQPRKTAIKENGARGAHQWLHKIRANQVTGKIDPADVERAYEQVELLKSKKSSALNLQWEEMGPTTIGGRTRAILIDPANSQHMFAAAVSGGLFETQNGGSTWGEVIGAPSAIIVSLAMAPNGDIYYGTGEGMYAGDGGNENSGFRGDGMYKSVDGGKNFTQLANTTSWNAVGKIAVDPNNSNRVYAATNTGLMVSDDAGESWQAAFNAFNSNAKDLFVTVSGKVWVKQGSGVYRSDNGNVGSFSLAPGLPSITGRARIAASPEDDQYVYVVACDNFGHFDKAYQSKDGGNTWNIIGQRSSLLNPHGAQGNPQGNYNNMLGVSPINKERIFVGGVTLWEWSAQNGWLQIASLGDAPGSTFYVHADNHEIVFDPNDPTKIYVGNDGGIFKSSTDGFTWAWEVRNYVTTQFYHIAVGSSGEMLGGTQDNGTIFIDPSSMFPKSGKRTSGINLNGVIRDGDGGDAEISRLDPDILFKEMQYGLMGRSTDGGVTFDYVLNDDVDPRKRVGDPAFAPFVTPFTLWESRYDNLSTDSIRFSADSIVRSLGFGNGNSTYTNSIPRPQPSAKFLPEGIVIRAGSLTVTSDANGNLTGDGTGNFNVSDGTFTVTFNNPVNLEIVATAAVYYEAGATVVASSATNELPLPYTLPSRLNPTESVMIQDVVQSMFFVGVTAYPGDPAAIDKNEIGGIWMTRGALSELDEAPTWYHVAKLSPGANGIDPQTMTVSADGNTLWMGTRNGVLYRCTNLAAARDSAAISVNDLYLGGVLQRPSTSVIQTSIARTFGGRAITGIAVHPYDPNRVLVTLGNYGNNDYVYLSTDALTGGNFNSIQGNLPKMPVYSATFNFKNRNSMNEVIVGTEAGVYSTSDVSGGNPDWSLESNGIGSNVPIFDLIQDRAIRTDLKQNTDFEGAIYAGTHGRGIFKTTSTADYISIDEPQEVAAVAAPEALNVFPNPATSQVSIGLNLENRSDAKITIRDINGKLVKTLSFKNLDRDTKDLDVDVSRLTSGTYILTLQTGSKVRSGKLIIAR